MQKLSFSSHTWALLMAVSGGFEPPHPFGWPWFSGPAQYQPLSTYRLKIDTIMQIHAIDTTVIVYATNNMIMSISQNGSPGWI